MLFFFWGGGGGNVYSVMLHVNTAYFSGLIYFVVSYIV